MMDKNDEISDLRWNAFQQFISARVAQVRANILESEGRRTDPDDGSQSELIGDLYHPNDKSSARHTQRAK